MIRILSFAWCTASLTAQAVLHVGPGQPHADVAAAIAVAAPGDRVLVHAGTYAPFTIDKGIVVRAEPPGAAVSVQGSTGTVTARIPAGQHAILQGITVRVSCDVRLPSGATGGGAFSALGLDLLMGLSVRDACATLQDCYVSGGFTDGITGSGSATISATQCEIRGGFNGNPPFVGPVYGVLADQQAQVHLSNCSVTGGMRGWLHSVSHGGNGVGLFGAARGWFVDSTLEARQVLGFPGVGLETASSVPPVLERVVTRDELGQSPSVSGTAVNGFLLGVSTLTPLARGSVYRVDFASRAGLPVFAHVSFQLAAPTPLAVVAQPVYGFAQNSLQIAFAVADAQGRASMPFAIPNSPWLADLPLWFCAWSEQSLPVQLSPVIGGLVR